MIARKQLGIAVVGAAPIGAQCHSGDDFEVISRPEVGAVIVSTAAGEHVLPVVQALELDKAVPVERHRHGE